MGSHIWTLWKVSFERSYTYIARRAFRQEKSPCMVSYSKYIRCWAGVSKSNWAQRKKSKALLLVTMTLTMHVTYYRLIVYKASSIQADNTWVLKQCCLYKIYIIQKSAVLLSLCLQPLDHGRLPNVWRLGITHTRRPSVVYPQCNLCLACETTVYWATKSRRLEAYLCSKHSCDRLQYTLEDFLAVKT